MKDIIYSDEELMEQIKAENMCAFETLYNKYNKQLYKFAYSIVKSNEEAENIIQDVFLTLWQNRHKVEKNSSVKYYIFTIAYNSAILILRRKARDSGFFEYLKSLQDLNEDPVNLELEYKELSNKLDEIIENLPSRQKEVYRWHKVEGLKYSEIAEKMNISVNTIETHMSRALKTIREKLGTYSMITLLFWHFFV